MQAAPCTRRVAPSVEAPVGIGQCFMIAWSMQYSRVCAHIHREAHMPVSGAVTRARAMPGP